MSLFNLLLLLIIWRMLLHCTWSGQVSAQPLASTVFMQVLAEEGSLAKLSGVQNQPTPHLVSAQISFLFRLPTPFPFTLYDRREEDLGERIEKVSFPVAVVAGLSSENVHELQLVSIIFFRS